MNRKATAVLSLLAAAAFTGCSNKAIIKPSANILKNGNYRSHIEAGTVPVTGLSMQLNGNGRFSMATLQGGCFVAEDWGSWTSSQEELTLSVQKSTRRASCTSPWQTMVRDTTFICPMRSLTNRSFQMLHDEIAEGTVWTAWQREASQGYAELEHLRMEPDADEITMDVTPARRNMAKDKNRAPAASAGPVTRTR